MESGFELNKVLEVELKSFGGDGIAENQKNDDFWSEEQWGRSGRLVRGLVERMMTVGRSGLRFVTSPKRQRLFEERLFELK